MQESQTLVNKMRDWAADLGFQALGIAGTGLGDVEQQLEAWLARNFHGEMEYLAKHGRRRTRPTQLVPGTRSIIMLRMDHLPENVRAASQQLNRNSRAYIARYALGRDYHKLMRRRVQQLASLIEAQIGPFGYRAFVDSAPVMEKPLAARAGLGWQGKHTNLINKSAGSFFLLGTLYTNLSLPADDPTVDHCGSCRTCLDVCPTQAIVAPYQLDARRCISYLTIELKGSIPVALRSAIGNRIFGCDDCQLFCPWNKFAKKTCEGDFQARHGLDDVELTELFAWTQEVWQEKTQGSALRRPGFDGWLRNIAVALGNATPSEAIRSALRARADHPSPMVREHVRWALAQQESARHEAKRSATQVD